MGVRFVATGIAAILGATRGIAPLGDGLRALDARKGDEALADEALVGDLGMLPVLRIFVAVDLDELPIVLFIVLLVGHGASPSW